MEENDRYRGSLECLTDLDKCAETTRLQKKLYDTFLSSNALLAYLRLRPLPTSSSLNNFPCLQVVDPTTVLATSLSGDLNNQRKFTFTEVFTPDVSQEDVFNTVAAALIDNFICGRNVLLFAYGPTSSGKTYTVQGNVQDPGILPRTLDKLFKIIGNSICLDFCLKPEYYDDVVVLSKKEVDEIQKIKATLLKQHKQREIGGFNTLVLPDTTEDLETIPGAHGPEVSFSVWLSFYEIYNENVYDLLSWKKTRKCTALKVGQDLQKRAFVKGLREVPVANAKEAYELLCVARANLHTAGTLLNACSSRSHCCFNIRLVQQAKDAETCTVSTLTICDLAGLERSSKAGTAGSTLREAGRINSSLMVLSRCLESLRNNQNSISESLAPFRESKLTQIMQPFFSNGSTVAMVVNVNPEAAMADESFHALKFSAIACEVVTSFTETTSNLKDSCTRLTELWQRSSRHWSSVGHVDSDRSGSPEQEFGKEEVDQLFETIRVLTEKHSKAEKEIERQKAFCTEFLNHIEKQNTFINEWKEMAEKDTERRVRYAEEFTKLQLYSLAENGSVLGLYRQLEQAYSIVLCLQKEWENIAQGNAVDAVHQKKIEDLMETLIETLTREDEEEEDAKDSHDQTEANPKSSLEMNAKPAAEKSRTSEGLDALQGKETQKINGFDIKQTEQDEDAGTSSKLRQDDDVMLELQKAVQEKEERIEQLQSEIEKYRRENAQRVENLEQEFSSVQLLHEKEVWTLKSTLKMKEETIRRLMEEADKRHELCNGTEELHHGQIETNPTKLQKTLQDEVPDVEESTACEGEEAEMRVVRHKMQCTEAEPEEMPEGTADLDELRARPDGLSKELADLKGKLEAVLQEKCAVEQSLASKTEEVKVLCAAIETEQNERQKLRGDLECAEASKDSLKQQLDELNAKYSDLQVQRDDIVSQFCAVQRENETVRAALESTRESLTNLRTELEQQHAEHKKDLENLETTKEELRNMTNKYENLLSLQTEETERSISLQSRLDALQEDLSCREEQVKELRDELEAKQKEEIQLRKDLLSAEAKADAVLALNEEWCTRYEKLQKELNIALEKCKGHEERHRKMEAELAAVREDLQEVIDTLEASKRQLERQLSDTELQLRREREAAREEKARAEKLVSSKDNELKALREDYDRQMCRLIEANDLLEAEKDARLAAEDRVCSREEEVNRLKASQKQEKERCSSSESAPDGALEKSDEGEIETRTTRAAKRRQTLRQSRQVQLENNDAEFKVPRRKTRSQARHSVCKDKEDVYTTTPAKRPVLVEPNSSSTSPLKRLGNYIAGILPGNLPGAEESEDKEQISASAKKRRNRKQLLPLDVDFFENDVPDAKAPEVSNRSTRMRTRRN